MVPDVARSFRERKLDSNRGHLAGFQMHSLVIMYPAFLQTAIPRSLNQCPPSHQRTLLQMNEPRIEDRYSD